MAHVGSGEKKLQAIEALVLKEAKITRKSKIIQKTNLKHLVTTTVRQILKSNCSYNISGKI